MPRLGVNIDHVATLREARKGLEPDPFLAAELCCAAGAHGITLHLREDRRHIQEHDVRRIRDSVRLPLNLEMAATKAMVKFALDLKPDMATLVPERREELTTEGGLDVAARLPEITSAVSLLQESGVEVSLFIEPDARQTKAALNSGARFVEFHTGAYGTAHDSGNEKGWEGEIARLKEMTRFATKNGLSVNMGHGLNYTNTRLVSAIEGVHEFNIGHSIIARSVCVGLDRAVKEMLELIR